MTDLERVRFLEGSIAKQQREIDDIQFACQHEWVEEPILNTDSTYSYSVRRRCAKCDAFGGVFERRF